MPVVKQPERGKKQVMKITKVGRLTAILLVCLLTVTGLAAFVTPVAATAHISLEKTTFVEGEPIMVKAYADHNRDWVGIFPLKEDGTPATSKNGIRWSYILAENGSGDSKGAGNGVAFDIRKSRLKSDAELKALADEAGISDDPPVVTPSFMWRTTNSYGTDTTST